MKQGKGFRRDDSLHWWGDKAARYPLLTAAEEVHLGQLIRAWQDHPAGPDGAPAGVRRRGMRARDRMVTANLRLVMKCAGRQQHDDGGNDLLQAGAEGLIKAALRFDPERGYKFSTFAYWWIWQGMGAWRERNGTIYVSQATRQAIRKGTHAPGSEIATAAAMALQGTLALDTRVQCDDGDVGTIGDTVPMVAVDQLDQAAATEALEAFRDAGGEEAALLELQRVDGATLAELAELEGSSYALMQKRLQTARQRLRQLAEVQQLLAA